MKTCFSRGVTLIELIIVLSIMITLLGVAVIGLSSVQRTASIDTASESLIADLREQQIKAMNGATGGDSSAHSFSVHFDSSQYVLFRGTIYSSSDASNYIVTLNNLRFENPGTDVVFSKRTGEIGAPLIIDLRDIPTNKLRRIHLNKYGVVNQVESL